MPDIDVYDDPLWEYVLVRTLKPYIPAVQRWWKEYKYMKIKGTGVQPIQYDTVECPNGLSMRMTSTPVRSPIKGVQAFPFVPTAYLNITGVPGGVIKMVERVCQKGLEIDGFVVLEKHNLPSTYNKGQFVAFVPRDVLDSTEDLGKYVYLTTAELIQLAQGICPRSIVGKCSQYLLPEG